MARDEAKVGRWRSGGRSRGPERTGPASAKKWVGTAIVSAMLAAALGAFIWLCFVLFIKPGPQPYFLAFWVGPYDRPEIPATAWLDADRKALADDKVFSKADTRPAEAGKLTLEVMQGLLKDLAGRRPDEDVIVYLSAYAVVDREKKIQIMAADSAPYESKTQLALSTVLGRLKDCPAKNKLLVLDIMRGMIDPRDVGATADGVGDLVALELRDGTDPNRLNDPNLLVIAACGPGQAALGSESLRHSVFGYYVHRALTTNEADANNDGEVSARELAAYLTSNVDAWSRHYRGIHQKPVLLGREQGDFGLAVARTPPPAAVAVAADAAAKAKGDEKDKATVAAKGKESAGNEKDKAKAKEKEPGAEAVAADGPGEPAGDYPSWLAQAWDTVERWRTTGAFQAAPRVYRRLAREAIQAEQRWRGGEPDETIRSALDNAVAELTAAMAQAQDVRRPPFRSVGQARDFGRQPDPALTTALAGLLNMPRNTADDAKKRDEAIPAALAAFKGKAGLDLAFALVDATQDATLDDGMLKFLDAVVDQSRPILDPSKPPREVLELMYLHQLARRAAAMPGDWKPETAGLAWRTMLLAEQVHSRPEAMAWVRRALDDADASLHEARVLLLPVEAAGYASWDRIAAAWNEAANKYRDVDAQQRAIRDARASLSRTLAALVSLIPYLEATPKPELQTDWMEAADRCGELARMLEPPTDQQSGPPGAFTAMTEAAAGLDRLRRKLMAPFQPAAVKAIVESGRSAAAPDPELALQIDALLLTPFVAAADRRALHDAGRALDARLDKTWRPGEVADSHGAARGGQPGERARRRFNRMVKFLMMAGDEKTAHALDEFGQAVERSSRINLTTSVDTPWDMSDPAVAWSLMARVSVLAYAAFDQLLRSERADELDRPGWLAPAYIARLGDRTTNPTWRARERAAGLAWNWLAAHYRHESRDLHEQMDPDNVLDQAANECRADDPGATADGALRIDGPTAPTALSPRQSRARVTLQLSVPGADDPRKVVVDVIPPEDQRLRVAAPDPAEQEVSPTTPTRLALDLELSDDPPRAGVRPPVGLIVRARTPDGRTYHELVALSVVPEGMVPSLALSRSAAECQNVPMDRIRLRPIDKLRQKFYVFVRNPTDRAWGVTVEVRVGDKLVGTSGPKPLPIPAQPSPPTLVPGFNPPAPKPDIELHELAGPIRLRLIDAGGAVLDEKPLGVAIAEPADYLEVTRAEFTPTLPGRPNNLSLVLRPLPALAGLPCPVKLVLPMDPEYFPDLREPPKVGNQYGELKPGTTELTLYVENLMLAPSNKDGWFYLNVDGVERALWFRSRFPQVGPTQKATEPGQPRVRLVATPKVEQDKEGRPGDARLEVAFQVDEAPSRARLEFRLGQSRNGQIIDDLNWRDFAKRRHLGFDPGGEGGALLFEASIKDQVLIKDVRNLLGERQFHARLLDETGRKELAACDGVVTLDDRLPDSKSVQVPSQITRGARELKVRATVAPPPSRIKEVAIIFGRKDDFDKAVADNRSFKAKPEDAQGREWSATLPVPPDAPANLVVTVRFTTGVGLKDFAYQEVTVVDPPKPEEMKAAAAAASLSTLKGIVTEGDRPQRGLRVFLLDPMPMPPGKNPILADKETDEKGAYAFPNIEPKLYRIYCIKQDGVNNRHFDKQVKVEPGKTIEYNLELTK